MKQLFTELSEEHPVLKSRQPLKVGIRQDIHKMYPGMSRRSLGKLLAMIAHHDQYLTNTFEGNNRFALDSTEGGKVSAKEADYAMEILKKRRQDEKKQATLKVSTPKIKEAKKVPKKTRFALLTLKKTG